MPNFTPILEYGLTGLSAILAFFSYRLLVKESEMKSPRTKMLTAIKSFAILAIVLATISATSSAIDTFFGAATKQEVTDLREQLLVAKAEIERLNQSETGQEAIVKLEKQLVAAQEEIKRLQGSSQSQAELTKLRYELVEARDAIEQYERSRRVEAEITERYIADRLLSDFPRSRTAWKGSMVDPSEPSTPATESPAPLVADESEAHYRILKRAVFNHLSDFECDAGVLSRALSHLVNRGRSEVEAHVERIVSELPQITQLRLRWLEDDAIPALRKEIELYKFHQKDHSASVPIPKDLWLFQHAPRDEPTEVVVDLAELQNEVRLLKENL